ncbi:OmpA family protein [Capnocytophaga canis]|uniref:OmpA/MotB domain protein n=1 Tax=Capnocytophaga canis TaxID=1848903 RepID=A0A0B7HX49_9FLAO|nr:OmpA family protein [Capnocytophaga canis]CEN43169.1 OmpA/MotB domain protein [Capnocytophaga canis]
MKKKIFTLGIFALAIVSVKAQEDYNKWSIDLQGGVNSPLVEMSEGYSTSTLSPWNVSGGVRYMFNNKFGLRLGGGYDSFKNKDNTPKFESNLWNVNLQGIANIGRVLGFEEWTSDLGLLAHAGVGYGQLKADAFSGKDQVAFGVVGLTPQLRISNRITLVVDGSFYFNGKQDRTFDGFTATQNKAIQGINFVTTVGLQFAIGKHGKHADWHSIATEKSNLNDRIAALEKDVAGLQKEVAKKENKMNDANGNNIPDEIENYLNENYATKNSVSHSGEINSDTASDLIRKGYINVYFDFNSSKPQSYSIWAADFVAKFLKENPSSRVNVVGFADELGGTNYNQSLSKKRADTVKQLLIDSGINASRITSEGRGEDKSVNKNSAQARQIVRKATFELK